MKQTISSLLGLWLLLSLVPLSTSSLYGSNLVMGTESVLPLAKEIAKNTNQMKKVLDEYSLVRQGNLYAKAVKALKRLNASAENVRNIASLTGGFGRGQFIRAAFYRLEFSLEDANASIKRIEGVPVAKIRKLLRDTGPLVERVGHQVP